MFDSNVNHRLVTNIMTQLNGEIGVVDEQQRRKIQSLREMILNAERTIQSAKAMLLQLEGKKRVGRKHYLDEENDGSKVVQGTFDGQIMQGGDGKQYPVPANYASKSKLVEGDMLKLTITTDGSFVYKQIGPVERKHAIGIVTQDEHGGYYVIADGKPYRVLLASVTYFKAEPGDEAVIVVPRDLESRWGAIENIIQKAKMSESDSLSQFAPAAFSYAAQQAAKQESLPVKQEAEPALSDENTDEALNRWAEDIKAIEKELQEESLLQTPVTVDTVLPDEIAKEATTTDGVDLLEAWRADVEEMEREIQATNGKKPTARKSKKTE